MSDQPKNPVKKKTATSARRRAAVEKRHPKHPTVVKEGRMWVLDAHMPASRDVVDDERGARHAEKSDRKWV